MSVRAPWRAARLVAWGNAFLLGWTSLDEAAERIVEGDGWHRVDGLPGGDDVSVTVALGRLSRAGVHGLRLALPVPGDVSTLPGPAGFNAAALAAGEAALCDDTAWALVPAADGHRGVRWRLHQTSGRTPAAPGLSEAGRGLAAAVREATAALVALDVAGAGLVAEQGLARLRETGSHSTLPAGYPTPARDLLDRAARMAAVVELAATEEGAAHSAGAMAARRAQLADLAAAARRAIVAGYNAPLEAAAAHPRGAE